MRSICTISCIISVLNGYLHGFITLWLFITFVLWLFCQLVSRLFNKLLYCFFGLLFLLGILEVFPLKVIKGLSHVLIGLKSGLMEETVIVFTCLGRSWEVFSWLLNSGKFWVHNFLSSPSLSVVWFFLWILRRLLRFWLSRLLRFVILRHNDLWLRVSISLGLKVCIRINIILANNLSLV